MLVYKRYQTKKISTRVGILIQWIGSSELLQNSHQFCRSWPDIWPMKGNSGEWTTHLSIFKILVEIGMGSFLGPVFCYVKKCLIQEYNYAKNRVTGPFVNDFFYKEYHWNFSIKLAWFSPWQKEFTYLFLQALMTERLTAG